MIEGGSYAAMQKEIQTPPVLEPLNFVSVEVLVRFVVDEYVVIDAIAKPRLTTEKVFQLRTKPLWKLNYPYRLFHWTLLKSKSNPQKMSGIPAIRNELPWLTLKILSGAIAPNFLVEENKSRLS
jgi:hypothetical protein